MPSLLMQAAQSAAEADGVVAHPPDDGKKARGGDAAEVAASAAVISNVNVKSEERGGAFGVGGDGAKEANKTPIQAAGNSSALNQIITNMNGVGPNQGGHGASSIMGGSGGAGAASVDPSSAMAVAAAATQAQAQQQQQQARQSQQQQQVAQPTPPTPAPAPAPAAEPKKRAPLRRGKWTPEEDAYANRLIQEFKAGLLPLTDGTTLRTFLSRLLNCDPMRISKKFVGSNCIGKQVFRRRGADVNNLTPDEIEKTRFELSELANPAILLREQSAGNMQQ